MNRQMVSTRSRAPNFGLLTGPAAYLAVLGWCLALILTIELFRVYNWEAGRVRFVNLLILVGLSLGVPPLLFRRTYLSRPSTWLSIAGCIVIVIHVTIHVFFTYTAIASRRDMGDQGEINYRAIRLLAQGVNPYGARTLLDIVRYRELINEPANRQCLRDESSTLENRFQAYWTSMTVRDLRQAAPSLLTAPVCDPLRRELDTMGFKYGPVLLLSYYPFVIILENSGIYIAHFVILLALCVTLAWKEVVIARAGAFVASLSLLLVLAPTILRFSTLRRADCDLLPTLLAVFAVLLLERRRDRMASACLALSIGAKLLPGLLFVPLLIGARRQAWLHFCLVICAIFIPFAIWDWRGFKANVLLFNLVRGADSTSLAYYLPTWAQWMLLVLFGLAALLLIARIHRHRWRDGSHLAYAVAVLLLLFGSARIFHNNYLVWVLPFLGSWVSFNTRRLFGAAAPCM